MLIFKHTPRHARVVSRKNWMQAALFLLVLCALWLAGSGNVLAQQENPNKMSDADEKALRTYTLQSSMVDRALAVVQDARREQIKGDAKGAKSLDGIARSLSDNPKAKALLDKHQIGPRDYVMTMLAVMRAGAASETNPKTPEDAGTNAANIAFIKANNDRIVAAMRGGQQGAGAKASAPTAAASK